MYKCFAQVLGTMLFALAASEAVCAVFDRWFVRQIYSNENGSVQFLTLEYELELRMPRGLAGTTLVARTGASERKFTIPNEVLPDWFYFDHSPGDSISVLVATQGFVGLNTGKPDIVIPNGFLPVPSGSIKIGDSEVEYSNLPTDGVRALFPYGLPTAYAPSDPVLSTPNAVGAFMPGRNAIVEYHNEAFNAYFLTAYQSETDALDNALDPQRLVGWKRTGSTFTAWTAPFMVNAGDNPPTNLLPVCRVWLGDSHFYSISAAECEAVSQFPHQLETPAAFFATMPDVVTGACPVGQTPLFRLWNTSGTVHRYTTDLVIREQLRMQGYVVEGYGVNSTAMCVGGKAP